MDDIFNDSHLKLLYRFLGHSGFYSRMGSLDYSTKQYSEKLLFGEEEVIKYAREWNGKRNIFLGRGCRNKDGIVTACNCISFDIDPIREKGVASTNEQHLNAINAGRRILSKYPGGYLSSSGNGCLLLYHIPNLHNLEGHYAKEAVLIKELQKETENLNVRIDSTNYSEAIIKALGTMSTKGDIHLRRVAKWIDYPILPFRTSTRLLRRLADIVPTQSIPISSVDLRKIESAFDGDRSTADFHLVSYLKRSGVGPADCLAALQANPIGRKTDEKDQARLIAKVYGTEATNVGSGGCSGDGYFRELFSGESDTGSGIRTGFKNLDATIRQLPSGELTVFAARSGYGKTSFAITVGELLRQQGKRVLYFSTEMHTNYIMHKLVGVATGISPQKLIEKSFTVEEAAKIRSYGEKFKASPITISDEFQPTLQSVQNLVLKCKPDVIIFDHISQVETHWEHVAKFARGLKELAKNENIPILVLAELNEPPRGKDGTVAQSHRGDIRGTQEILFLSALFMYVSNPYEIMNNYQPVQIHLAKNRYGISGVVVPLTVDKELGLFMEKEWPPNDDKSDLV